MEPAARARTPAAHAAGAPRRAVGRAIRRAGGLLLAAVRHPVYAVGVVLTLLGRPRLLWASLRRGWRPALHAHCARLCPAVAEVITPYEAGFFGQVFVFDEYEAGRIPLPRRPVVLDVGANVGFFCWRVRTLRPEARILAFEPQSDNHLRLARLFEAVGIEGEPLRAACGAHAGIATLHLRNSVTHSLRPGWHRDLDTGAGSEEVRLTTLDAECGRRGIGSVDLLKVDVEGAEADVLGGAAEVLRRTSFVVLEYHSPQLRAECLRLLRPAGFRCRDKAFWGGGAGAGQEGLLLCRRAEASWGDMRARAVRGA